MWKTQLAACLVFAVIGLSGCAPSPSEPNTDTHATGSATEGATGFIRPGTSIPETADFSQGDIPLDTYGRPYTYGFLGEKLPSFSGETYTGGFAYSRDWEGQWILLKVWGMWCGDCLADAPFIAVLAERLADDPEIALQTVHTPPSAARADEAYRRFGSVEAYFEQKDFSYPTILDTDASIRETLQIVWTPTYILIAPDGTVQGFRSELSASGDDAVAAFLSDINQVKDMWEAR